MIEIWSKYKRAILANCVPSSVEANRGVNYWRNSLFATTLIFILPLCFIALIPSLFLITFENKEYITLLHFITIGLMCFIAFVPSVKTATRKLIFSLTVYAFAITLNIFTSPSSGSVLVYFLAACVYSIIIFDNKYAYWWSHLVLFISIFFGFAIAFDLIDFSHNVDMSSVNEWIAVSSNLIFLCYLSSALIPKIFKGIENYISEQQQLKTELEASKKALQVKNEELEQYAYVASHDLQEPLRMVTSFMHKLSSNYGDQLDEKGKKYITFAENGAVRMKQIVLDLLDFSRVNRPSDELELVDLDALLLNYLELREGTIAAASAKINWTEMPTIWTIKPLITTVFHNLLDNGLKYRKKDTAPSIDISAREQNDYWEFAISDNGLGIESQFYDKIFKLFQRLHNSNEYEGTGVGLSIAKRSVEFMGGQIGLHSQVRVGSTFYFTIPKKINERQD
ncbi:sensor histidine kinase [Algoriphagus yeomjeoni]|uniref:histidine kinase n=1 Tax=Algoriphagus yeomjeoni TaxID=291403 RepID=A0A327PJ85_9BACT|nr:ATP-binding protein [Algoriphagus yeomjeoni]RAI91567.1 phospho-acceptor domain-containing protein [Algoriphagus yeomjeoni]